MDKIIIAIFLICNIVANGQTKAETENWIIEQTAKHKLTNPIGYDYDIQGDFLIATLQDNDAVTISKIPIRSISEILTTYNDEHIIFTLKCSKKCSTSIYKSKKSDYTSSDNNDFILLILYYTKDIELIPRISKAIKHLVKLNGGSAIVKSTKSKEPF